MATDYQVQTPLLRILVFLYSRMGVQLQKIHTNQWKSLLTLCWNVLFDLSVSYALSTLDPMGMASLVSRCRTYKPLFAYFVNLGFKFTYPTAFIVEVTYFCLYGRKILLLLDSACFSKFYHSTRQAKAIIIVLSISNNIFYLVWMFDKVKIHQLKQWPSCHDLLSYFTVYVICTYTYSSCLILHYYQFATYRLLKRIETKLDSNPFTINENEILQEIKSLATVNYELNQLTSFPWIVYLFLNVFNTITIICMALICQTDTGLMLQVACTAIYLAYLTNLNHKILKTLSSIINSLRRRSNPNSQTKQRFLFQVNENISLWRRPSTKLLTEVYANKQSRQMRFDQINLYHIYFEIQIFQLGCINFPFLLQTVLFIVCYVVFFSQTN